MIKNRNFIWNMIGNSLNSFLSLFLLIIVTRINGIELSGIFSYAFTLTLILQMISNYGGRIYQVSDYNEEFKYEDNKFLCKCFIFCMIFSLVSLSFVFVFQMKF